MKLNFLFDSPTTRNELLVSWAVHITRDQPVALEHIPDLIWLHRFQVKEGPPEVKKPNTSLACNIWQRLKERIKGIDKEAPQLVFRNKTWLQNGVSSTINVTNISQHWDLMHKIKCGKHKA